MMEQLMRLILNHKLNIHKLKKSQFFLGLFLILSILFLVPSKIYATEHEEELEERLYENMSDYVVEKATESLLVALETKEDGAKLEWNRARYSGYVIPTLTFINEQGYSCRDYLEVLIRDSEYNIYENKACRDHDGAWIWIETTSANQSEGRKKTIADWLKNRKKSKE